MHDDDDDDDDNYFHWHIGTCGFTLTYSNTALTGSHLFSRQKDANRTLSSHHPPEIVSYENIFCLTLIYANVYLFVINECECLFISSREIWSHSATRFEPNR